MADLENEKSTTFPFAVYKMQRTGRKTKDSQGLYYYGLSVLVVSDSHEQSLVLEDKVRAAILSLQDESTNVTFTESGQEFDPTDRAFMTEIKFEIKTF